MTLNSTDYKRILLLKTEKSKQIRFDWNREREERFSDGRAQSEASSVEQETEYRNSSQKSEKNQDLEESWIRRHEDQDDQASTD